MRRWIVVVFCVMLAVLLTQPETGFTADKVKLRWGSTSTRSGFYAYFVALSKTVMKAYPELDITVVETGAGLDNLKRLRESTVHFGGLNSAVAYAQYAAVAEYKGKEKFSKLRALYGGFVLPINIFVRADSDVYKLEDLNKKPFAHFPGSSADRLALFLFDANNVKPKLLPIGPAASDAIKSRRAIGSQRLGIGEASIMALQATVDLRFIPITEEEIQKTQEKYPGQVSTMMLPANSYPKQDKPVPSLAYAVAEYTTTDVSADVVYKVVRAIHEGRSRLAGLSKSLEKGLFETAPWELKYQDVPLHTGAIRYFKEIGVPIPKHLIPPEAQ